MTDAVTISYKEMIPRRSHFVQSVIVDNFGEMVTIVIQKELKVEQVRITMEHAQAIGFINFDKLLPYCEKI